MIFIRKYFIKKWTPWAHFGTYSSIKNADEIDKNTINEVAALKKAIQE